MELEIDDSSKQLKKCKYIDGIEGKYISDLEIEIIDENNIIELSIEDPIPKFTLNDLEKKSNVNIENIQIQKKGTQYKPKSTFHINPANEKHIFIERYNSNHVEVAFKKCKKSNSVSGKLKNELIRILCSKVFKFMFAMLVSISILLATFQSVKMYDKSNFHKELQNKVQKAHGKIEKLIEKEPVSKDAYQKVTIKQPRLKSIVIYSWTNEKGQKMYSNVGFPEDGKYIDPKIEWQ